MRNNKSMELNTAKQNQFIIDLIKHVSQPMIVTAADRRLLHWNAAFSKLTGYNNKELSDPTISAGLTAPEWHESETKAFEKLQRTGKSQIFQKEYIRKDGTRVPVEVLIYQLSQGNGKVHYYIGLITDITERKNIEEALRQSEDKYRRILEQMRESYFEVDLAGRFTFFNDSLCRGLGYSREELMGMNYKVYTPPEEVEKLFQAYNQVYRTGEPLNLLTFNQVRKDGTRIVVENSVYPLQNEKGEIVGFGGISRNVTERVRAEQALTRSEGKYRTILEDIEEGYYETDLDGNYTFFNDIICKKLGYSREELTGVNFRIHTDPEDVQKIYEAYAEVYRTGKPLKWYSPAQIRKDGKRIFAEDSVSLLRNEKGEIIGYRGISHDITQRKQMEEDLRQSEEKYRSTLDHMEEAYSEVDLAGNFIFFNNALCKHLGYSREELMGMNYKVYTSPEIVNKVYKSYNQVYRIGEPINLFAIEEIRKDGMHMVAEISVHPRRNETGEIIGFRQLSRDVTKRKQAEEALRQSEEKYRTVLENMAESYYEVDLAGRFTFFNDSICHELGYSREELMGISYKVFTPPEAIERVFDAYHRVYTTGEPITELPMEQIRKDGTRLIVENSVFPIRNEQGEIVGFRGVGRDVTERARMEEVLRRSEERYRSILEEMQDSYFEVDLAGNYTFVNNSICHVLGYTFDELIGKSFKLTTTSDDAKRQYEAFHQIYLTGQPIKDCGYTFVTRDDRQGYAELSAFPIRNEKGEIVGFRGVSHDITQRMRIEEALRQSEERYRTVLEDMQEGYYELDLAGNYTFFNEALCRQLGYSKEEIIGMNYRAYTPPEMVKEVFQAYNLVYRTGEPLRSFPIERIRKDGMRVFAETSAFPLRDEKGEIIGFKGVINDITERMQAERQRKELEQKAQLASRLASVGELASGVAHEINNPLTGVIGYAHLLLARKDLSRDVRRDLEIINEGAQRVAGIVKKLLTFARQTRPEERYVNINELIRNTLELRAYELSANNIKVTLQLTRDMPMTIADPGQLQQVFLNLIINAETEMKLANDKGKLAIKTERMNNTLRISFKDTGPGIAKEHLDTIFDPFFTTREVGQGTGLGLSVCHGIITEHNGKIWAESELGKGATFIIELPLVTEEGQFEPEEPVIEESPRAAKAKILVVDDEPVIRQFISQVLSEQGHTVETIDNAASALKMVKSKRYRLILLDIKMPGMSGIELYKQFQKIAPSLTKRIVFITGDVMGKRTIDFLNKTKTHYIMKPFDAKQLKAEINRVLIKK